MIIPIILAFQFFKSLVNISFTEGQKIISSVVPVFGGVVLTSSYSQCITM